MSGIFSTAQLHSKVVLVTGASGGIGAATAKLFARAGANVVLAARRAEALAKIQAQCEEANKQGATGHGGKYASLVIDMRQREQIDAAMGKLPTWAANVDILGLCEAGCVLTSVNNAGLVYGVDKVGDIDPDEIDAMLETNVRGLIHLTQLFVKRFKERKAGHVINLGSIAGREAYPGGSIYCATKFAVRAFTSALMKELVDTPIRVSNIEPGMVETDFSITRYRGDKQAADKVYEGLEPLSADDIAAEIVWAANRPPHVNIAEVRADAAAFLTPQMLVFPVNQASPYHVSRQS